MRSSGTLSSLSSSQWPVLRSFNAPTLQYWRVYTTLEKMSVNRPVRRFWCCSWCCCGRIFIDSLVSWWWLWSDGAAPAGTRVLLLSLRWLVGGICRAGWHRVVVYALWEMCWRGCIYVGVPTGPGPQPSGAVVPFIHANLLDSLLTYCSASSNWN